MHMRISEGLDRPPRLGFPLELRILLRVGHGREHDVVRLVAAPELMAAQAETGYGAENFPPYFSDNEGRTLHRTGHRWNGIDEDAGWRP